MKSTDARRLLHHQRIGIDQLRLDQASLDDGLPVKARVVDVERIILALLLIELCWLLRVVSVLETRRLTAASFWALSSL